MIDTSKQNKTRLSMINLRLTYNITLLHLYIYTYNLDKIIKINISELFHYLKQLKQSVSLNYKIEKRKHSILKAKLKFLCYNTDICKSLDTSKPGLALQICQLISKSFVFRLFSQFSVSNNIHYVNLFDRVVNFSLFWFKSFSHPQTNFLPKLALIGVK